MPRGSNPTRAMVRTTRKVAVSDHRNRIRAGGVGHVSLLPLGVSTRLYGSVPTVTVRRSVIRNGRVIRIRISVTVPDTVWPVCGVAVG